MLYSLLKVKFDWSLFMVIAMVIFVLFPGLSWYSYFAILISLHQFMLFFSSINNVVPVRYLFGIFMCLQFLIGPMMAYNGLDQYQFSTYQMQIPEERYFSYVLPALISFIIGLHFRAGRLKGEVIDTESVYVFVKNNPRLPYVLIVIGFLSSIASDFFASDMAFVFVLIGGFKFIGLFLLILGNQRLKLVPLLLVIGSIISSSLSEGLFHDLLTWVIFTGVILAVKFKPGMHIKLGVGALFILLSTFIQQLKGDYRQNTWQQGNEGGVETFAKTYEENKSTLFNYKSLAASNVRINQGFIITYIMKNVPAKEPYAEGKELYQILEAAIMPRILAPDKLNAGDRSIFIKYSGFKIAKGTSMGLSSIGDAYINFGITGGCIFMFLLGLLYNEVLKGFLRYSKNFPVLLLFTPLVFYYPIRPDCELQTILGHLVKSCFLVFVVFLVWKKYFKISLLPTWKRYSY